jgi:hypothetical protein
MSVPLETAPRQGDGAALAAMKSNAILAGSNPPAPPAGSGLTTLMPTGGDTIVTSLKKICALLGLGAVATQQQQQQTISSIILTNTDGSAQITLSAGPDGDLWVAQQTGPNAGKQVDLTYGKWQ